MNRNMTLPVLLFLLAVSSMTGAGVKEDQQFLAAVRDGKIAEVRQYLAHGMNADTRNAGNDETALMIASNTANIEMMEVLISAGARVDAKTGSGQGVLGVAVAQHRHESVKFLLQHGAKIKQLRRTRPAAFHGIPIEPKNEVADALFLAVLYDQELLKMLLAAGADVDSAKPSSDRTALMEAAYFGKTDAVKQLLEAGADVNRKDKQGTTAFDIALQVNDIRQREEYPGIRRLLLEYGAKPTGATAGRAYAVAIEQVDIPFLEGLVAHHVDMNQPAGSGDYPLRLAVKKNSVEMSRFLIEHGADPDIRSRKDGRTAIFDALKNPELFRLLVQHHASFDVRDDRGYTVLASAMSLADANTITEIINSGHVGDVIRENGGQLLMTAVNRKLPDIAALLIRQGADVEYLGTGYFEGKTPLQLAFDRGNKDAALVLIKSGADIHRIKKGHAPFLFRTNDFDLTRALLEAGANINEIYAGETPLLYLLHSLDRDKNIRIVEFLLENGARADIGDAEKYQFVMYQLCLKGELPLVKRLSAAGVPLNQISSRPRTPLVGASMNGSVDLVRFLLDRGARVNDYYELVGLYYWNDTLQQSLPSELTQRVSPLTAAAEAGNRDVLALLINRGADVNVILHSGMNALMLVVDDGSHAEEVVSERRRRDTESYLRERNMASSVAAMKAFRDETRVREKPEIADSSTASATVPKDVTVIDTIDLETDGSEYKRYRVQQEQEKIRLKKQREANRIDMMKLLIDAGTDVNRQDEVFGQTPLMQAIRIGDPRAVKLLLDAGARPDLRDKAGKTPSDYASASGDSTILQMLRSATANTH